MKMDKRENFMKKLEIILVRHGKVLGNLEKRYIGSKTDQELCEEGIKEILELKAKSFYPKEENFEEWQIFSSPMKRCLETSNLVFPGKQINVIEDLKEMDFGIFEGKNYKELKNNTLYQAWIDSNCKSPIEQGESYDFFINRTYKAFEECILQENVDKKMAFFVHGGTIMAILSVLIKKDFYSFMLKNGAYYKLELLIDKTSINLQVLEKHEESLGD